jgi:hypothetical protein
MIRSTVDGCAMLIRFPSRGHSKAPLVKQNHTPDPKRDCNLLSILGNNRKPVQLDGIMYVDWNLNLL